MPLLGFIVLLIVQIFFQIMKQFLEVLNVTERNAVEKGTKLFASQLTTESLRVTLLSTLDIISYLFDKGAIYVLTAKLNQDPLEVAQRPYFTFNLEFRDIVHFYSNACDFSFSGILASHVHLEAMSRTLLS